MDNRSHHDPQPFGLDEGTGAKPPVSDNEKTLSGLAYVSQFLLPAVMPVVLLLSEESKRSAFVRYHSLHSLALLAVAVVYELLAAIALLIIGAVFPCLLVFAWTLLFVPIVPFIYYGLKAFQGECPDVPFLTSFLQQNRWL